MHATLLRFSGHKKLSKSWVTSFPVQSNYLLLVSLWLWILIKCIEVCHLIKLYPASRSKRSLEVGTSLEGGRKDGWTNEKFHWINFVWQSVITDIIWIGMLSSCIKKKREGYQNQFLVKGKHTLRHILLYHWALCKVSNTFPMDQSFEN